MGKFKSFFTNWRILLMLAVVLFALIAIRPNPWATGVSISSVAKNSPAELAGIESPRHAAPMAREVIEEIDGQPVVGLADYARLIEGAPVNETMTLRTNKGIYRFIVPEDRRIGLRVAKAPRSNVRLGLELQGGTRVLLEPEEGSTEQMIQDAIDSMSNRLNVYGLADILVTKVTSPGLPGEPADTYIRVEVPGASEEEVKELVSKQGKFEAEIGNATVFVGGSGDITYVCRTAQCSGIDPQRGCGRGEDDQWICGFFFQITLSPTAARRQAGITGNLSLITEGGDRYLSEQLVLKLDDTQVDALNIAGDLKGRAITDIQITGSGTGVTEQAALRDALENMKNLQTVLVTGSLPIKLTVARTDAISPVLGVAFLRNAWIMAGAAVLIVLIILVFAYRRLVLALPLALTAFSEVFILLGSYALFGWSLDLAAIAGVIAAVGTGVDHQIIIADETLRRKGAFVIGFKERVKRAFRIITSAYATTVIAMVPLLFAGAGLLKGFAIATITGVTIGVLITRPAFAHILELIFGEQS